MNEQPDVREIRPSDPRLWWVRPGLEVRNGRLALAGRDAEAVAREEATPVYAYDLFAEDYPFPPVEEGDVVAMLGVGSYNAAMAMEHCLRPRAGELFFADRLPA